MTSETTKREIPLGLAELLEGFVFVVLKEKPENLLEFAAHYFRKAKTKKNSLREHGANIAELGVDFYIASNWHGLV